MTAFQVQVVTFCDGIIYNQVPFVDHFCSVLKKCQDGNHTVEPLLVQYMQ